MRTHEDVAALVERAIAGAQRLGIVAGPPGPTEQLSLKPGGLIEALAFYVVVLEALIEAAGQADRSKPYAVGEALPSGLPPAPGERWPTPAEIAAHVVGGP